MTKSKIVEIFKRLDDEKFSLLQHNVAFEMIVKDRANEQYLHTGIGDGADMSQIILYSILSMYVTLKRNNGFTHPVTIEDFAENIKELAIKAYEEDLFQIESNEEGGNRWQKG